MWNYEKKLQYPVNIKKPNPAYAKIILTQLGGPDGEMGATTRYTQPALYHALCHRQSNFNRYCD